MLRATHIVGGPGDPGPMAEALRARGDGQVLVPGDGTQRMAPVYAGDVVDSLLSALQGSAEAGTCDLAGPDEMTLNELVLLAQRRAGAHPPCARAPGPAGRAVPPRAAHRRRRSHVAPLPGRRLQRHAGPGHRPALAARGMELAMDLSTEYLGLKLPHPFMPGASPLADDLDTVRRLEDAGAPPSRCARSSRSRSRASRCRPSSTWTATASRSRRRSRTSPARSASSSGPRSTSSTCSA